MKQYSQGGVSLGGSRHSGSSGGLLVEGARAWGFSSTAHVLMLWSIPVIIVLGAVVAALLGKPAYKWYTGEDQFAEVMQVLFYTTALIFSVLVIKELWQRDEKAIAGLYMIVLFGLTFLIGEELSWGQRIFGWETSEEFKEINKQDETNLHNVYGIGSTFKWVQMLIGAYGAILPVLLLKLPVLRNNDEFFSFVIPHFTLIPFFLPLFLWRFYRNVFDPPKDFYFVISEFNEVMEFVLAVGMALFMIFQYRRLKAGRV